MMVVGKGNFFSRYGPFQYPFLKFRCYVYMLRMDIFFCVAGFSEVAVFFQPKISRTIRHCLQGIPTRNPGG